MTHMPFPRDIPPMIEVTRDPPGISMGQLVRDAYEASRERVIVLLLIGVTAEEVDAALDPIVPLYPLDIPGLKYVMFDKEVALRSHSVNSPAPRYRRPE